MRRAEPRRSFLSEIVIPFLCAIMALWGIAQARAQAGKLGDPAPVAAFMLCTPGNASGGDPAPDHDCGNCSLPNPASPIEVRFARVLRVAAVAVLAPAIETGGAGRNALLLPWSRGPPDRA